MKIFFTRYFVTHSARLEKKLPDLTNDILKGLKEFNEKTAISIGNSIYKIRIKSSNLNKGKSGGLRCYVFLMKKFNSIVPLCIYLKSEQISISPLELERHFDCTINELLIKFGSVL